MWYKVNILLLWTLFGKNVLLRKNELRELLLKSAYSHWDENELWKSSKDWKTKRSCATSRWRLWCMEKHVPAEIWHAKGELLLKWLFFVIAHLYARFLCYLKDGKHWTTSTTFCCWSSSPLDILVVNIVVQEKERKKQETIGTREEDVALAFTKEVELQSLMKWPLKVSKVENN